MLVTKNTTISHIKSEKSYEFGTNIHNIQINKPIEQHLYSKISLVSKTATLVST